jgi:hypothetical protein|nr:glycosyltransferase [Odoribacter splanchnicus]
MKKILHISKFYYPYVGGIEDVCYNIVKFIKEKEGYSQKVFCFNNKNETVSEQYEGIDVLRVAVFKTILSQPLSFTYGKELKKILNTYRPDIIHFHAPNPLGMYVLLKCLPPNVRLIVHWHSDIIAQRFIYFFFKPLEKRCLHRADLVIATSNKYFEGSRPMQAVKNKVIVIPNIIDPGKFELTEERSDMIEQIKSRYGNKPIVLFVGRHSEYKGLRYLIAAAELVYSDCVVLIGGEGELTQQLKELNKTSKVYFIGRISDKELAAYYYAADIFAFPSITKNEAFGVALAEAMYCRTPAITFTIFGSGVNWVNLNGVTGIEVANADVASFAKAIDTLLGNKEMREEMAMNAKKRVEELFIIEKIKNKIEKLY